MAAILMYLKSKTLLPEEDLEEDEEESSSLQKDLSQLLFNYRKFQIAGKLLYKRNLLGRDTWPSTHVFRSPPSHREVCLDKERAPFFLVQNYGKYIRTQEIRKTYKSVHPLPSLGDRLRDIAEVFARGVKISFSHLISIKRSPYSSLLTFLSLLELSRLGFVSLFQKTLFSDINVTVKKTFDDKDLVFLDHEEKKLSQTVREEMH